MAAILRGFGLKGRVGKLIIGAMAKILIVDDNGQIRNMYSQVLSVRGYQVAVAGDGLEAVAKISSEMPDLILLDVMMPKLSGMKVLEAVRANAKTKSIPVVMFTNLANEADAKRAKELGVSKYLIKSDVDPTQLVGLVHEMVKK